MPIFSIFQKFCLRFFRNYNSDYLPSIPKETKSSNEKVLDTFFTIRRREQNANTRNVISGKPEVFRVQRRKQMPSDAFFQFAAKTARNIFTPLHA